MYRKSRMTILLAALVTAMVAVGCSDGVTPAPPQGSGGGAGAGGAGGAGGGGGGPAVVKKSGSAFVNAGSAVESPNYKMVFTLGQSTPTQTTVSSPGYVMHGGLIGATSTK